MKKFELTRVKGQAVNPDELIPDLNRVAKLLKRKKITQSDYRKHGLYSPETIQNYFGTWNKGLLEANLQITNHRDYSNDVLFKNILTIWEHHGRQPRRVDLASEPSIISQSPYNRKFGSWTKALIAFVEYANEADMKAPKEQSISSMTTTPRQASLRLRFRVLKRDNFTCCACGASPANQPGLSLHVDHIQPWSEGGQTTEENLQTLCEPCNLGKSNVL